MKNEANNDFLSTFVEWMDACEMELMKSTRTNEFWWPGFEALIRLNRLTKTHAYNN